MSAAVAAAPEPLRPGGTGEDIVLYAPTGRDPELVARMLGHLGLHVRPQHSIDGVCAELARGAGIVILAEETLVAGSAARLLRAIEEQPSWSDIPVIVLTTTAAISRSSSSVLDVLRERANVTLLERPVHPLTLVSSVQSAMRARRRQYEMRDYLLERDRTEERVRHAQKMDAVGKLAGGVAHEVNNMMTAVIGFAEYALKRLAPDHPVRPDVEEVIKAGTRAAAVTQQLLAFSRRQPRQPKVLYLQQIVPELSKLLIRLLGVEIQLDIRLAPDLPPIFADRNQLEQVLVNLALNARDAMQAGGCLTVEGAAWVVESPQAHTGASRADLRAGRYVAVAVRDTGHGMSAEARERAFEPFFTTKPLGQGTGLGLSTVYAIVEQSSGTVWIDSEPGRGTTVTVCLPAASEEAARESAPVMTPTRGRETVLVVEDEPAVRRLARRALEEHGYSVIEAGDGQEALGVLGGMARPVGLVLSDLVMPRMNGRELGHELGRRYPALPVLFMSGYTGEDVRNRGLLERSAPFIQKPFTPDGLARRVRAFLDGDATANVEA